jgi:malonyl-CoA O-methyltransferase
MNGILFSFVPAMKQPPEKSNIASAYDDWAESYDTVENLTRDLAAQALRLANLNFTDRKIIEVGYGTGRNTEWLAGPDAGAIGIVALDFSEEMLARARARLDDPRVRFIQHDVRSPWPFANATADVVVAMLIMEHIEHLEPIFAEAARTLKPGGELFLCELHPERQLMGKQAQFTNTRTGKHILVSAFLHHVSDYINIALSSGFQLVSKSEWRDDAGPTLSDPPRLLSLHFQLPKQAET